MPGGADELRSTSAAGGTLEEVGLRAGELVTIEPSGDGELRVRRSGGTFEEAFGSLTGTYPPGYLARLDAEDEQR